MQFIPKPLYMVNPAYASSEIQDVMDSFYEFWLSNQKLPEGCQLYHYTTLRGMQGILMDRALWCSHSATLNDPLEIQYGLELISNILIDSMKEQKRESLRLFLRELLSALKTLGMNIYHTFVACFCESGNLLSQWQSYADKGGCYCIGIEFSSSTRFHSDLKNLEEGKPPFLRKVIYDKQEQQDLVRKYVREVTKAAETAFVGGMLSKKTDPPYLAEKMMALQASNVLLDILHSFKHPAFKSEEEWRMVYVAVASHQPEKLCFRENSIGIVPYRKMYIYDLLDDNKQAFPLRSIGFGPMLDPIRTGSAIELRLENIATDNHDIILMPERVEIKEAGYRLRQ